MKLAARIFPALVFSAAAIACAQTPSTLPAPAAAPGVLGDRAPAPLSPEARDILKMLEDRKKTLKDFTAKVDYSVEHITTDIDGKTGTVNYLDTASGPEFSIEFTLDFLNGKPTHPHKQWIICDPKHVTAIDFQARQFDQSPVSTGAGSLESEVPIPIGIRVEDVTHNFNVILRPADPKAGPDQVTLRLTPLVAGKFNYKQLDVTVDKKLQIPVKLIVVSTNGEPTTIKFIDPDINSGKARMLSAAVSTEPGWNIHINPAAPATLPAPTAPAAPTAGR